MIAIYKNMKMMAFLFLLLVSFGSSANSLTCQGIFENSQAMVAEFPHEEYTLVSEYLDSLINSSTAGPFVNVFGNNEFANNFSRYAIGGNLLKQTDPVLGYYGLLRPNGGLCASTCMANAVFSMVVPSHKASHAKTIFPEFMHALVEQYRYRTNSDARYGAYVNLMAEAIRNLLRKLDEVDDFGGVHGYSVAHIIPRVQNLVHFLSKNSLVVGTVSPIKPHKDYGVHFNHAIVILGIDQINRQLYISDPNRPNVITRQDYLVGADGSLIFLVPFTYGADVVQLINTSGFYEFYH